MKTLTPKLAYNLVIQSEDKNRTLFEGVIYGLLILSAIVGMWQFAAGSSGLETAQIAQSELTDPA